MFERYVRKVCSKGTFLFFCIFIYFSYIFSYIFSYFLLIFFIFFTYFFHMFLLVLYHVSYILLFVNHLGASSTFFLRPPVPALRSRCFLSFFSGATTTSSGTTGATTTGATTAAFLFFCVFSK